MLSAFVCCQPTELILGFFFVSIFFQFYSRVGIDDSVDDNGMEAMKSLSRIFEVVDEVGNGTLYRMCSSLLNWYIYILVLKNGKDMNRASLQSQKKTECLVKSSIYIDIWVVFFGP